MKRKLPFRHRLTSASIEKFRYQLAMLCRCWNTELEVYKAPDGSDAPCLRAKANNGAWYSLCNEDNKEQYPEL